jgi:transcriptional/translational regulatory protein YebC/TACO1
MHVDDDTMEKVSDFIDLLEDNDDVQRIWTNLWSLDS